MPYLKSLILFVGFVFIIKSSCIAIPHLQVAGTYPIRSTPQDAFALIDSVKKLNSSSYWPNINPESFLLNIKTVVQKPATIYAGTGTNFCGYAALTYLYVHDDPLTFTRFLLDLYQNGNASMGNINFKPSLAIRENAGRIQFRGILDIHPAEQMWFLSLADHYKGYLNLFSMHYKPGYELNFWASVNYSKFNRMAENILKYKIQSKGSDLLKPSIKDKYGYIQKKLETGPVVLYINNRKLNKKNYRKLELKLPTHFIVLHALSKKDDLITLYYWDYGSEKLLQISLAFFEKITFGISCLTKPLPDEK